ncbi:ATP-grasp domain-containing protein [Actinopolyspora mortivallis]|uniref:ATP-grasp domain-containing protein n=1 Tax=Actinopolyspora mortivallis TaxID=33906 RepID=UPI000365322A|nr:ATP-grasp domain-containing protein [Actinopolyspora mortivallis]
MSHLVVYESWLDGHGRDLPSLLDELGCSWTFVTRKKEHYRRAHGMHPIVSRADRVIEVETNEVETALPYVRDLVGSGSTGIFTVCDYYIPHVVELCDRLRLPCAYPGAASTVHDKARTRALLDEAGIPNPRYVLTDSVDRAASFAASVGYPVVCKPADMAASVLINRVGDEEELRSAFFAVSGFTRNFREQPRDSSVLVEEWLTGREFSVETSAVDGKVTVHGVTQKVLDDRGRFIEVGHQFPAPLPEDETRRIEEFTRDCLRAVGHDHGVTHTEVTMTERGPRLVEINSRPGGGNIVDLVRAVTGCDLLLAEVMMALGRHYEPPVRHGGTGSAASAFLIPDRAGTVREIAGVESASAHTNVERVEVHAELPEHVERAVDNAARMCVVIARDPEGSDASRYAQEALKQLDLVYEGE